MEQWKPIKGTNGKYEVSSAGNVRSLNYGGHGQIKEVQQWNNNGYKRITIRISGRKKNLLVHRVVAEAFVPNPENKAEVNHKDGNKHNNSEDNLEWSTRKENLDHADKTGLREGSIEALLASNRSLQKPIIATSVKTGEEIKFVSIQAAQRTIGTRDINRVLNGDQKKAKGYTFRYAEEVMPK